jgi:hypothetical protein
MKKGIIFSGLCVASGLLLGCQSENTVGSQPGIPAPTEKKSEWINYTLQKNAVFDPARIDTGFAPIVFSDDTIPAPDSVATPSQDANPLAKSAYLSPLVGVGNGTKANDVAIGNWMYYVRKSDGKLFACDLKISLNNWTEIKGPLDVNGVPKPFKRIAAAKAQGGPYTDYVVAITSDGATYQMEYGRIGWWYMNGGGNGVDIAVEPGGQVCYIGANNNLNVWNSSTAKWTALAGQAGMRVSMSETGHPLLVSNGYHLYFIAYDGSSATGTYMNAWTVDDVSGSKWPYRGSGAPIMHSGTGLPYFLKDMNPIGGGPFSWKTPTDGNLRGRRNLACALNNDPSYTNVITTDNEGYMTFFYYTPT